MNTNPGEIESREWLYSPVVIDRILFPSIYEIEHLRKNPWESITSSPDNVVNPKEMVSIYEEHCLILCPLLVYNIEQLYRVCAGSGSPLPPEVLSLCRDLKSRIDLARKGSISQSPVLVFEDFLANKELDNYLERLERLERLIITNEEIK